MQVRFGFRVMVLAALLGCGSGEDEASDRPDAAPPGDSSTADASSLTDAAPECTAPMQPMLLYPTEGCDAQPQWYCISAEAGSRSIRYCLCEPGAMNDDLGWPEGAMKPWVGKGVLVYAEPGCDGSVSPVCSDLVNQPGKWCGCSGETYAGSHPYKPYSHEGPCEN